MIVNYKGYKISYLPKQFKFFGPIKDKKIEIILYKGDKEIDKFIFHIPIPQSSTSKLTAKQKANMAIDKIKKAIDDGLEKNESREFQFDSSEFKEVV